MTQAVPHLVNRLVIDTEDSFDDVRRRYESLVPAIDFAELTEVVGTGDLAALQAYIAAHALSELVRGFVGSVVSRVPSEAVVPDRPLR
ncbi:hypothetical protein AB0958_40355 [Streptomyces sp. NPDC006655]|uniref:hypothetical protein n=1 Tax=Streptomyces sp. NPDC006655 TaxID=3156898 RepID=UPI00345355A9